MMLNIEPKQGVKMRKFKTKQGLVVYETDAKTVIDAFDGLGLCDACCTYSPKGYYIPVLNSYYCPKCYEDWLTRAKKFVQDEWYETRKIDEFEFMLKVLGIKFSEEL